MKRIVTAVLAVLLAIAGTASAQDVFSGDSVVELTLTAPLGDLFADPSSDLSVAGALSYRDADGRDVVLDGVKVSVRGHTSRQETECTFPKLKLRLEKSEAREASMFRGAGAIKIGTHCGESPDDTLTPKYGRLANQRTAHREAFVYRLLAVVGVPTLRARPARITYVDTSRNAAHARLTRDALVIEDDNEAMKRLGASRNIPMEQFTSARDSFTPADALGVAFGEALIGNFDWCLRFEPGDRYRCDARKPLWNMAALAREDGTVVPVIYDFDLSGFVTGRHPWFRDIFNPGFDHAGSESAIEVEAQLQRTRSVFPRAQLDAGRQRFAAKRADAYRALDAAPVDDEGKALARHYMDRFFAAMARDEDFYRPVVVKSGTRVLADADGTRDACSRGRTAPPGTPVSAPIERSGSMMKVTLLDALWHWTGPANCTAILKGAVWIDAGAVGTDYPPPH